MFDNIFFGTVGLGLMDNYYKFLFPIKYEAWNINNNI